MRTLKQQLTGRRRFMTWLGVAGLTTSAAVFASRPAAAVGIARACACCNLEFCPPNDSIEHCRSVRNYTWSCRECNGGCVSCVCCEVKGPTGQNLASAQDCRPS